LSKSKRYIVVEGASKEDLVGARIVDLRWISARSYVVGFVDEHLEVVEVGSNDSSTCRSDSEEDVQGHTTGCSSIVEWVIEVDHVS